MLKKTAIRSGWCMLVLALAACTGLKQPAAPTEAGGTTDSPAVTNADNPYGSAPYTPPPPSNVDNNPSVSTPVSTGYVPNYSPVDITAANHTVQRGDTVYNISKRYQITQDNLRSWNNLVDDNIKLGQVLRVKMQISLKLIYQQLLIILPLTIDKLIQIQTASIFCSLKLLIQKIKATKLPQTYMMHC
ncbi:LysM domain protein [Snodgrassella alvi SCGC AB-598-O02]|nr:LysM domain protein [Snodgrassella alvi SCGC AB-598-O02]